MGKGTNKLEKIFDFVLFLMCGLFIFSISYNKKLIFAISILFFIIYYFFKEEIIKSYSQSNKVKEKDKWQIEKEI